ncbi:hypothetical protein EJ02DRAFT_495893 [Clathrospora elynae]|uniref:C2H2-type domain-containing protein n=1 Tax=Clathrospora elynae TaxID=706981 RepID=A0A6A5SHC0_9PLEO|nr:hypothetical protein EJ02DRAFT_495893 [Clathrospora elynae]
MSSPSASARHYHERSGRRIAKDLPIAGNASFGSALANPVDLPLYPEIEFVWVNGHLLPYNTVCSSTLLEDAQAVLGGNANHQTDEDLGNPSNIPGSIHGIEYGYSNTIAPQALDMTVGAHANDLLMTPNLVHYKAEDNAAVVAQPFSNQAEQSSGEAHPQCPRGCRGTFGRPEEYRRHMRKHNGPFYLCNQPGCDKQSHRKDKLRDHLRQAHKLN